MIEFTSGLITMGFAVSGLFFLRFWRRTNEILFLFFAAAFWLFAISHGAVALFGFSDQSSFEYLIRLLGFLLIIAAILTKNMSSTKDRD